MHVMYVLSPGSWVTVTGVLWWTGWRRCTAAPPAAPYRSPRLHLHGQPLNQLLCLQSQGDGTERGRGWGQTSPKETAPHINLSVIGRDYPSGTETLKSNILEESLEVSWRGKYVLTFQCIFAHEYMIIIMMIFNWCPLSSLFPMCLTV